MDNSLEQELIKWVIEKGSNGIKQGSDSWKDKKTTTIGGSSIATVQGVNMYNNVSTLIGERLGIYTFVSNINIYCGNLFEEVIKLFVQKDKKCTIYGEDLYIEGRPNISYSPDGLTVMKINDVDQIVLVEFKCPFTRIPNNNPPEHYISQVKMGMDVLKIPTTGLLIEGVFRKCTLAQLKNNNQYDYKFYKTKKITTPPLAYGIIGFVVDPKCNKPDELSNLLTAYNMYFTSYGSEINDYKNNDIGLCDRELFELIMKAYDDDIVIPIYNQLIYINTEEYNEENATNIIAAEMAEHVKYCATNKIINLGIMPWKMMTVKYHSISKEENYLEPWMPRVNQIVNIINECKAISNPDHKKTTFHNHMITILQFEGWF